MKRLRVAVLMGGPGSERAVSLRSGAAVARALRSVGAEVRAVDVRGPEFALPAEVDVVFVALHGTFGEDGTVQRILEMRGVPYTGSGPEASERAFDKTMAKAAFEQAGVPTPRYEMVDATAGDWQRLKRLGFPLVVKPAREGSSVGITIVSEEAALEAACMKAWEYGRRLIGEQWIAGRELTVGILGTTALPVVEIRPRDGFFSYEAKYTPGRTEYVVPAPLGRLEEARVKFLAQRAHECLGCRDFSRVDMILAPNGEVFVLEVNTIPGFTETSLLPKAAREAKISFEQLCVRLVEMALARAQQSSSGAGVRTVGVAIR
jgi:D-alanine-D-alanine ligase